MRSEDVTHQGRKAKKPSPTRVATRTTFASCTQPGGRIRLHLGLLQLPPPHTNGVKPNRIADQRQAWSIPNRTPYKDFSGWTHCGRRIPPHRCLSLSSLLPEGCLRQAEYPRYPILSIRRKYLAFVQSLGGKCRGVILDHIRLRLCTCLFFKADQCTGIFHCALCSPLPPALSYIDNRRSPAGDQLF